MQNKCKTQYLLISATLNFILWHDAFSFSHLFFCFLPVHLVIPGLNETTVKLPTSIMFEISDAIKTQLGKQQSSKIELFSDQVLELIVLE